MTWFDCFRVRRIIARLGVRVIARLPYGNGYAAIVGIIARLGVRVIAIPSHAVGFPGIIARLGVKVIASCDLLRSFGESEDHCPLRRKGDCQK